ncbi:hypothetical protein CYLTODRAFT_361276 [Cylindrobasidium torrendii FP15055 ss-10]|uniref:C2H2-type domain-containing protein n=1 Tax=Cylindrobasidium torrendii FP15055 ss-10 TaxID=1314674 RepID=A0A0D7AZ46_9AGAR|nr:hypothetical protein CYLTODRAFT_361276 [Cylindrobasidium torrendii FP15055 ss-10]
MDQVQVRPVNDGHYNERDDEDEEWDNAGGPGPRTCQWGGCGQAFNEMSVLIDHIQRDHVGQNKSTYTCDWVSCSRRGIPQSSRFALTAHLRAHTGERPFMCPDPACDAEFTRSDALAKHLRAQHGEEPPVPRRGGSRKRKRVEGDMEVRPVESTGSATVLMGAFQTEEDGDPVLEPIPVPIGLEIDPATGLVAGRTPAHAAYLVYKAKYLWVVRENERLRRELEEAEAQLLMQRVAKDDDLRRVAEGMFGRDEVRKIFEPVSWR